MVDCRIDARKPLRFTAEGVPTAFTSRTVLGYRWNPKGSAAQPTTGRRGDTNHVV